MPLSLGLDALVYRLLNPLSFVAFKMGASKARGGRVSEWIRNRRATQPPAHSQRNPLGRVLLAFFRVARSLHIDLDMLVARALKNSQLAYGET